MFDCTFGLLYFILFYFIFLLHPVPNFLEVNMANIKEIDQLDSAVWNSNFVCVHNSRLSRGLQTFETQWSTDWKLESASALRHTATGIWELRLYWLTNSVILDIPSEAFVLLP
jgi:hypothetical protein